MKKVEGNGAMQHCTNYLKTDRAVVVHCSFHTAMRILEDIAVAAPFRAQQRVLVKSLFFSSTNVMKR